MSNIPRVKRLAIPACLCLATVVTTGIGSDVLRPLEAMAVTGAHAGTRSKAEPGAQKPDTTRRPEEAADNGAATTTGAAPAETAPSDTAAEPKRVFRQATATEIAVVEPAKPADAQASPAATTEASDMPMPPPKPVRRVVHRSQREICNTLARAARSNKLPAPFFIRLLFQESRFEADAVSHAGAQGIAQFMPKTAASVGLDNPFDPLEAIPAAARLLNDLLEQFGNLGLAAAAYNAGPGRVHKWLKAESELPDETLSYVKTVTGQPAENWKVARSGHGSGRLPRRAPCKDIAGLYAFAGTMRIPLPPKPPVPRPAPEVQTTEVVKKTTPKQGKIPKTARAKAPKAPKTAGTKAQKAHIAKSTGAKAQQGKKTAQQLAARQRRKKMARQ